jgi:hypothetical protein
MPSGSITEEIAASSAHVFAFLHDYSRRLEWDTLLSAAYLEPPATRAALGAISVCIGRLHVGRIPIRARYVAFRPPELAAVEMINRPPFFESFAASIRHEELGIGRSSVTYRFNFRAKPRPLRFALHPIMRLVLRVETKKRLASLRRFFADGALFSPA